MQRIKLLASKVTHSIGISSPATLVDKARLQAGLHTFSCWQIPVQVDDRVFWQNRYFAGADQDRAHLLYDLVRDPQIGTIWSARGGYGATRILPLLDKMQLPKLLRKNPKLMVGFSDVTALHFYFFQKAGLPSLHAPMPGTMAWSKMTAKTKHILLSLLQGRAPIGKKSYTLDWKTKFLKGREGGAKGIILGGNLTLLVNLIGTPWQPDLRGSLLFLEDCAEAPYRVDRMLAHLENAGMLKGVRGILLGDFASDVVYREPKEKTYWAELFRERFQIPVLTNLPVGHIKGNQPLPLGVPGEIRRDGKLVLWGQPVVADHS